MMKAMTLWLTIVLLLIVAGCNKSATSGDHSTSDTLALDLPSLNQPDQVEIVTWNIEHFPKSGSKTVDYVRAIIEELGADIYCLQEIENKTQFKNLMSSMSNYDYVLSEHTYMLALAMVFRRETIAIKQKDELWYDTDYHNDGDTNIHNNAQYQFASRPPLKVDLTWNNGEQSQDITMIDIHLKCCGNGDIDDRTDDEEYRRHAASILLQEYVEDSLSDDQVIIVGDWNDAIEEPQKTNVFRNLIEDSLHFKFADTEIATGNSDYWSWPGWGSVYPASHFDHVLITDELFDEYEKADSDVQTVLIENYFENGSSEYSTNVSDHRPVVWMFKP